MQQLLTNNLKKIETKFLALTGTLIAARGFTMIIRHDLTHERFL